MAHTYASNFIHCIFSTRKRQPLIPESRITGLHAYLGGIARSEGVALIAAGGTANHIHLLFVLPASHSLAQAVQKLKGGSSRWMGQDFSWQEGYGAFSVSHSSLAEVEKYIANQEEQHRKVSFQEEFVAFLKRHEIEYDERFLWE